MSRHTGTVLFSIFVALWLWLASPLVTVCPATEEFSLSKGQTVYVPVYSNVFSGPKALPFNLATILSVRNTDLANAINVTAIDYYDTNGKPVRKYLGRPVRINPLASTYIYMEERDTAGGFGANFIVRWEASRIVNAPIIECVMIGATSGQGISFVSPGRVIREDAK